MLAKIFFIQSQFSLVFSVHFFEIISPMFQRFRQSLYFNAPVICNQVPMMAGIAGLKYRGFIPSRCLGSAVDSEDMSGF